MKFLSMAMGVVALLTAPAVLACAMPAACAAGQALTWDGTNWGCVSIPTPPGVICGFSSDDHVAGHINVTLCQGMDPKVSCPAGYSKTTVFQADNNYLYTCYHN